MIFQKAIKDDVERQIIELQAKLDRETNDFQDIIEGKDQ